MHKGQGAAIEQRTKLFRSSTTVILVSLFLTTAMALVAPLAAAVLVAQDDAGTGSCLKRMERDANRADEAPLGVSSPRIRLPGGSDPLVQHPRGGPCEFLAFPIVLAPLHHP